jgi:hypothetical protein
LCNGKFPLIEITVNSSNNKISNITPKEFKEFNCVSIATRRFVIYLFIHLFFFFIKNIQYKISQYADDTSLALDGSPQSLFAALDTIEYFFF